MASLREWIDLVERTDTKPFSTYTEDEVTEALENLVPAFVREIVHYQDLPLPVEGRKFFEPNLVQLLMKRARFMARSLILAYKQAPDSFEHVDSFQDIDLIAQVVGKILNGSGFYDTMLAKYPNDADEVFNSLNGTITYGLLYRVFMELTGEGEIG